METKDVIAIAGVVAALGALGLGVYNVLRTRKIARLLDWLFVNDKRFELLRTSIETETLLIRVRTSLERMHFKLIAERSELSPVGREAVQKHIAQTEKAIGNLDAMIVSHRQLVTDDLTSPSKPTPKLIQTINEVLNTTKNGYSQALCLQAEMDAHIAAAKDFLTSAELLTEKGKH
ncbi:MAG: hypothetical protein ACKVQW_15695 [Pyrinomonadaceae bacterium]